MTTTFIRSLAVALVGAMAIGAAAPASAQVAPRITGAPAVSSDTGTGLEFSDRRRRGAGYGGAIAAGAIIGTIAGVAIASAAAREERRRARWYYSGAPYGYGHSYAPRYYSGVSYVHYVPPRRVHRTYYVAPHYYAPRRHFYYARPQWGGYRHW